jgi:hypothetical protein
MTIREELMRVLYTIGVLTNYDTNVSLLDSAILREVNLPERRLADYLSELNSLGLIDLLIRPSGANFRLLNLTNNGIMELNKFRRTTRY